MVWLSVFGVFNVRTDVDACEAGTGTVRESALKVDSGTKLTRRTGDSNPRQFCPWLFSRTLYQLSYSLLAFRSVM